MIYEIRTYQIAPGSLAEVEKRFGDAYQYRKKYSELTAFLHTEVGPLNEIVHIWGYKDLADRARVRGEASKEANWPPKIGEFIRAMRSEIITPFGFIPEPQPGKLGPVYELRITRRRRRRRPSPLPGAATPSSSSRRRACRRPGPAARRCRPDRDRAGAATPPSSCSRP